MLLPLNWLCIVGPPHAQQNAHHKSCPANAQNNVQRTLLHKAVSRKASAVDLLRGVVARVVQHLRRSISGVLKGVSSSQPHFLERLRGALFRFLHFFIRHLSPVISSRSSAGPGLASNYREAVLHVLDAS